MKLHLRATECHLSYGITQSYLPPDASEHTSVTPAKGRYLIYLPHGDGRLTDFFSLLLFPASFLLICHVTVIQVSECVQSTWLDSCTVFKMLLFFAHSREFLRLLI